MLVLAHRGYHAEELENTLAAFNAARRLGADGIETDVQVDRKNVPLLFHNRRFRGRTVASYSREELSRAVGYEVPTLVSALDAWPEAFWNLEVKMPTALAPVWSVLRNYKDHHLLVSSFRHSVARQAGQELGCPCGLLIARRLLSKRFLLRTMHDAERREKLCVVWEQSRLKEKTVAFLAKAGVCSFAYGPRTLTEHRKLASWGVAGLITDYPALGLAARNEADQEKSLVGAVRTTNS